MTNIRLILYYHNMNLQKLRKKRIKEYLRILSAQKVHPDVVIAIEDNISTDCEMKKRYE